jgi:hypothetical protein
MKCPSCHGIIFLSQFNQPLGQTICHFCSKPINVSEALLADACWRVDLSMPVEGTWIRPISGRTAMEIGGLTHSPAWIMAVPLLLGTLLLAAMLLRLALDGQGGYAASAGFVASVAAAVVFAAFAAMASAGHVVIRVDERRSEVFSGVGRIGWRRRFDWRDVQSLSEQAGRVRTPGNSHGLSLVLALESDRPIRFGALLNDVRRYFIYAALCKIIEERNAGMK